MQKKAMSIKKLEIGNFFHHIFRWNFASQFRQLFSLEEKKTFKEEKYAYNE